MSVMTICGGIALTPLGKKEYNRIKNQLKKERGKEYVTQTMETSIASLAQSIDMMNIAAETISQEGMTITSGREGETTKTHPALNTVREMQVQIRLSLVELGMTPKSRAAMNIAIPTEQKDGGFAAIAKSMNQDEE